MEKKMKMRCYHILKGEPVISLGLGEHPYFRGVEVYRFDGARWHEVDAIGEIVFKAGEISEVRFGHTFPIA